MTFLPRRIMILLLGCGLCACSVPTSDQQPEPVSRPASGTQALTEKTDEPEERQVDVAGSRSAELQSRKADLARAAIPPRSAVPERSPLARSGLTNRENYGHFRENGVVLTAEQPVSTFSIDVDTGAYSNMRRYLQNGSLPPVDSVRLEEFINYFDYRFPQPAGNDAPFRVSTAMMSTPWRPGTQLLQIGIQGYQPSRANLPPANLVFLVDVSGSMAAPDKLGLLQQSLRLLVRHLGREDKISLVVYAGASGVVLEPTSADRRPVIETAVMQLRAGGSTNGAAGIELAYRMAEQGFVPNGINRILLATDGDFNVGTVNHQALLDLVARKRQSGIHLTTLGFGAGNYNEHLMEQLADTGNGNYAYIDTLQEAKKVLIDERAGTLMTIAKDVKIRIEFNPASVSEYRLLGYENRLLAREDFGNDKVDAGEIGAGHSITALYEVTLAGTDGQRLPDLRYQSEALADNGHPDELAWMKMRFKLPDEERSQVMERPVSRQLLQAGNEHPQESLRFASAVAGYAQLLRGGKHTGDWDYDDVIRLARESRGDDPSGYRAEFIRLAELARMLDGRLSRADAPAGH